MIVGTRLATIDFPAPGGPIIRRLWPPATATSTARRSACWPLISEKSAAESEGAVRAGRERLEFPFAGEKTRGAVERLDAINRNALHARRLLRRDRRQQQAAFPEFTRESCHRERAAHGPRGAGEAELARDHPFAEIVLREQLAGGGENAERDRQIIERPFLAQMTRRKIDRGAGARRLVTAVAQRGEDAIVGLLDGGVRQADQDQLWLAGFARVDFDAHQFGLDALQGGGRDGGEHGRGGGRMEVSRP
jgi:hypothetical protein